MRNMLLVLKHDLITTITRKSFLLTLFLLPLLGLVAMLVVSEINNNQESGIAQIFTAPQVALTDGYVDESGLIKAMPEWVPAERLTAYANRETAGQALANGEITGYFILPADYLQTGTVTYVRPDFNPMSGFDDAAAFQEVLRYNLLNADEQLYRQYQQPVNITTISLAPPAEQGRGMENMASFFIPYIITFIFYVVILSAASFMLNSVTSEKQNRMLEVLMVSVKPLDMLTGKIIAMGLVGLLQTLVWTGSAMLLMRLSGRSLSIPEAFQLPPSLLVWGALFFVFGYALYASFMAGVGALVPSLKEASQATTIIIIPLVIPLILLTSMIENPNSTLALVVSLFPLTSPVAMMTRLSATTLMPVWQPVLALVLLGLSAFFTVRAVAGMFRAQTLLSGQVFNLKLFFSALAGKS